MPKSQRESRARAHSGRRRDRSFIGEIQRVQRELAVAAAIEVVEAGGYASLTVAKITQRSAISRRTFYELFQDREDCFLAAFEQTLEESLALVARAYRSQPDRHSGARAALVEAIALIDERPGLGRLCIVEALAAGPRVLERRVRALDELAGAIDRAFAVDGCHVDRAMVGATAAAITAMLHSHLVVEQLSPTELSRTLMAMIVLPYEGRAAANAELKAPLPTRESAASDLARGSNQLWALNLRLTYRTIRVLLAIAERPGASNLQIARASGIGDQGQISKLLRRLRDLKLIVNVGEGQRRGRPNAWQLTELGEGVRRATRGC